MLSRLLVILLLVCTCLPCLARIGYTEQQVKHSLLERAAQQEEVRTGRMLPGGGKGGKRLLVEATPSGSNKARQQQEEEVRPGRVLPGGGKGRRLLLAY